MAFSAGDGTDRRATGLPERGSPPTVRPNDSGGGPMGRHYAVAFFLAWSLSGCDDGGDATGATPCAAGASQACGCTDGRTGAQVCGDDGRFAACVCGAAGDATPGAADAEPAADVSPRADASSASDASPAVDGGAPVDATADPDAEVTDGGPVSDGGAPPDTGAGADAAPALDDAAPALDGGTLEDAAAAPDAAAADAAAPDAAAPDAAPDPVGPAEDCLAAAACVDDDDCPDGHHCNGALAPPRCQALFCGARGTFCDDDALCAPGLVCNDAFDPPRCAPARAAGEGPCGADDDCAAGLACNTLYDPPQCHPTGAAGVRCDDARPCEAGLRCNSLGGVATCEADGGLGARCGHDPDADVLFGCAEDLACAWGLDPPRCEAAVAQAGDWCDYDPRAFGTFSGGTRQCPVDLVCRFGEAPDRCGPAARAGERCAYDSECAPGLACNHAADPSVCVALGAGGAGAVCNSDDHCAPGHFCASDIEDGGPERRCAPWPVAAGDLCTSNRLCPVGLACTWAGDADRCVGAPGAGDRCSTDREGPVRCLDGLACTPSADGERCAAAVGVGEPCGSDFDCPRGLHCDDAAGACVGPAAAGAPCDRHTDCAAPLACLDTGDGARCTAPGGPGAPCDRDSACGEGLTCFDGACRAAGAAGDGCDGRIDCAYGLDCRDVDGRRVCATRGAVDDPCAYDGDCGPGLLCNDPVDAGRCVVPGSVAVGEACDSYAACVPGAFCDRGQEPPACAPLIEAGAACDRRDGGCQPGLACAGDPAMCVAPVGLGAACDGAPPCRSGLRCNDAFDPPQCRRGDAGELCDRDNDCLGGFLCNDALDPPRCQARDAGVVGTPCDNDDLCQPDLDCNRALDGGVCVALRSLPADTPCGRDAQCVEGLVCNGGFSPATCAPPQPVDGTCSRDRECEDDLLCNTADWPGRCAGPAAEGEPCGWDDDCAEGLECNERLPEAVCVVTGAGQPGTPCDADSICAEGLRCDRFGGLGCFAPRAAGERCEDTFECADGLRCYVADAAPTCDAANRRRRGEPCASRSDCLAELGCSGGQCTGALACDACEQGAARCGAEGVERCADTLDDACLDWRAEAMCAADEICRDGQCLTALAAQGEGGPLGRLVHFAPVTDRAAALAARCDVIGANRGAGLGGFLVAAGGVPTLDALLAESPPTPPTWIALLALEGWAAGQPAEALDAIGAAWWAGQYVEAGTYRLDAADAVAGVPAFGPGRPFDQAGVDRAWLDAHRGTMRLPGLLPAPVEVINLELSGALSADGPGFALGEGRLQGHITFEALLAAVTESTVLCAQPAPPPSCAQWAGFAGDPVETAAVLLNIMGADVQFEQGQPFDCFQDCTAVSLCATVRLEGVAADGYGPPPEPLPAVDCADFCRAMDRACPEQYPDTASCLAHCRTLPAGAPGSASDDLACRVDALRADPVDCGSAGPWGQGRCGTACDALCRLFADQCSVEESPYGAPEVCRDACAAMPAGEVGADRGNSSACRLFHALRAPAEPARCAAASPTGDDVCGSAAEAYCDQYLAACPTADQHLPGGITCVEAASLLTDDPENYLANWADDLQCRTSVAIRAAYHFEADPCTAAAPTGGFCSND